MPQLPGYANILYGHIKHPSEALSNFKDTVSVLHEYKSIQSLDRIYHCAKKQNPMWFGLGMRVQNPECAN